MSLYNPYILLRTESGKWSKYAPKYAESLFSSLIPNLEDLPDELVLHGTVGKIIDEEWKYYEKLSAYITAKKKRSNLPPVVNLHEIIHISCILNLPVGWQMYVHVSANTPQNERLDHLMVVGELVYKNEIYRGVIEQYMEQKLIEPGDVKRKRKNIILKLSPYIMLFSLISYTKHEEENIRNIIHIAVCGLVHNAVIRRDMGLGIEVEDVLFDDILPLLSRICTIEGIENYIKYTTQLCM